MNPVIKRDKSESINIDRAGSYFRDQIGWSQKTPFDLVLPYQGKTGETVRARLFPGTYSYGGQANACASKGSPFVAVGRDIDQYFPTERTWAVNEARQRFSNRLGESAQWLANLGEAGKSWDMIAARATQLRRSIRALRRFDIPSALRELNLPTGASYTRYIGRLRRTRGTANTFLELHFGWEPLVRDINSSVSILSGNSPVARIKARSRRYQIDFRRVQVINPTYHEVKTGVWVGYVSAEMGANVSVLNQNLNLASRLGLTNLASVAWELVPWSFLVDWVFNVGQFIDQYTDLDGFAIRQPYTSTILKVQSAHGTYQYSYDGGKTLLGWEILSRGSYFIRKAEIESVKLSSKPFLGLSKTRAATAIALLAQAGFKKA